MRRESDCSQMNLFVRSTKLSNRLLLPGWRSKVHFDCIVQIVICLFGCPSIAAFGDDAVAPRQQAKSFLYEASQLCGDEPGTMAEIATTLARLGELDASKKLFAKAWEVGTKTEPTIERRMVLLCIAKLQASVGQAKEAVSAIELVGSANEKAIALSQIAVAQAQLGDTEGALSSIALIPDEEKSQRDLATALVGSTLADGGRLRDASRVLEQLQVNFNAASRIQKHNDTLELSHEEQAIVSQANAKATALVVLAESGSKANEWKFALNTADQIGLALHRSSAYRRIACIAAKSGDTSVALEAIERIVDKSQNDQAYICYIAAIAKQGHVKNATGLVEKIVDINSKAEAMREVAIACAHRADSASVQKFLDLASALSPMDKDESDRVARRIVSAYLQSRMEQAAEDVASKVSDRQTASEAFQEIAITRWHRSNKDNGVSRILQRSLQAASEISDLYTRSQRFRALALAEFEVGEREKAVSTLNDAASLAEMIGSGAGTEVSAFIDIARSQFEITATEDASRTLRRAMSRVAEYPDESYRGQLFESISETQAQFGDVKTAIQSIKEHTAPKIRVRMLVGAANGLFARSH